MSTNIDCESLDGYLAGELSADSVERFAAHLESCDACREAIEQQRWIDDLLRSPLRAERESPPSGLIVSLRSTISHTRQRAGLVAGVFAAAAALLIALGWTALLHRPANRGAAPKNIASLSEGVEINENANDDVTIQLATTSTPRAMVATGPDTLAVPIESPYPDITIVRLYPTYRPENDELTWSDHPSNGGSP